MKNIIKIKKFFVSLNGNKYVKVKDSGIPSLYLMTDGIQFTRFEGEEQVYIKLEEIIRWNKSVLNEFSNNIKNKKIIEENIKFWEYHLNREIKIENETFN